MDIPLQATKEIDANGDGTTTPIVGGTTITISKGASVKLTTDSPRKADLISMSISPGQEDLLEKLDQLSILVTLQKTPASPPQNYPVAAENPKVGVESIS